MCRKERIQGALSCVFFLQHADVVHVGDGDEEEGDDEGRCSVVYPAVKPSRTS